MGGGADPRCQSEVLLPCAVGSVSGSTGMGDRQLLQATSQAWQLVLGPALPRTDAVQLRCLCSVKAPLPSSTLGFVLPRGRAGPRPRLWSVQEPSVIPAVQPDAKALCSAGRAGFVGSLGWLRVQMDQGWSPTRPGHGQPPCEHLNRCSALCWVLTHLRAPGCDLSSLLPAQAETEGARLHAEACTGFALAELGHSMGSSRVSVNTPGSSRMLVASVPLLSLGQGWG